MKYSHKLCIAAALTLASFAPGAALAGDVETGRALFADNCQVCHGPNGDGNGPSAEAFILKPRDFAMAAYKFDTDADWERGTDADLANVISNGPGIYGGSTEMPAWDHLSADDITSLVAFIRSLET